MPKKLLGSEVKITVVKRPINIKKETMKLLDNYLHDLLGVYIINDKPIELLAISLTEKEILSNEKIKISLVPLTMIKKDLAKQALKDKLIKAKVILNRSLLHELRKEIKD